MATPDSLFLKPQYRAEIIKLLQAHLPQVTAWAYGSRVNGRAHDSSDLDLVLRSTNLAQIPTAQIQAFRDALQESNIPILVEARDWATLPQSFQTEILRQYIAL